MTKSFSIEGMTCGACVSRVKTALLALEQVKHADVQLDSPQATLTFNKAVDVALLNQSIGKYSISELDAPVQQDLPAVEANTYFPLFLIVGFILMVSLLAQFPFETFSWKLLMRYFMAGFFIVFSFFKLLNLSGFANAYQMYDVIAAKWKGWGFIYPFVELSLGLLYLTNLFPFYANIATIVILGLSSIGVIKSVMNKEKIQCACLGDVFQLPMSTITIIEDVGMVLMAVTMLLFS